VAVHRDVPAEGGPDLRMGVEEALDRGVEAVPNGVVSVEDVHEPPACPFDASVEVAHLPNVACLAVVRHPAAQLADDSLRVVRRAVVDDLDLHAVWPGILRDDAGEGLP